MRLFSIELCLSTSCTVPYPITDQATPRLHGLISVFNRSKAFFMFVREKRCGLRDT